MNSKNAERVMLATASALIVTAGVRWRSSTPVAAKIATPTRGAPVSDVVVTDSALAAAEEIAVSGDPFRLSNSPPDVRYDPTSDGLAQGTRPVAPPPLRPVFTLKAIVGGPPWQAVIDGLPGQPPGTVTRAGTRYDKLLVRSVTRDGVIIQGPDTSWSLSFGRRP